MNEKTLYNAFAGISDTLTDAAYDAKIPPRKRTAKKAVTAILSLALVIGVVMLAVAVFTKNETVVQKTPDKLIATELVNTSKDRASISDKNEGLYYNPLAIKNYYDATAPKTVTVTVEGNEYTGTYNMTLIHQPTESPADEQLYIGRKDSINYGFGLNAETGELMSFCCYDDAHDYQMNIDLELEIGVHRNEFDMWRETNEQSIPEELKELYQKYTDWQNALGDKIDPVKARAVAEKYASVYLGEYADEYVVEADWSSYDFHYTARRMINGLKSADALHIIIDNYYQIAVLRIPYLGSFDGIDSLPFSIEAANAVIAEKAEEKSKSISGFTQYEYKSITPIVLQDGSVGVIYEVDFSKETSSGKGGERYYFYVSPEKE